MDVGVASCDRRLLKRHTILIALDEQSFTGDQTKGLIFDECLLRLTVIYLFFFYDGCNLMTTRAYLSCF